MLTKTEFSLKLDEDLEDLRGIKGRCFSDEEYQKGQKNGKAEVERLDKIRNTDIKKILAKNKKALEWWTSI